MTSERRILANRRNAARSTGPRTARGKARSARNAAATHGLCAARVVLTGPERARYSRRRRRWTAELGAADERERALIASAAFASIVVERVARLEADAWAAAARRAAAAFDAAHPGPLDEGGQARRRAAVAGAFPGPADLRRLLRHGPRWSRAVDRALNGLFRLRRERRRAANARSEPSNRAPQVLERSRPTPDSPRRPAHAPGVAGAPAARPRGGVGTPDGRGAGRAAAPVVRAGGRRPEARDEPNAVRPQGLIPRPFAAILGPRPAHADAAGGAGGAAPGPRAPRRNEPGAGGRVAMAGPHGRESRNEPNADPPQTVRDPGLATTHPAPSAHAPASERRARALRREERRRRKAGRRCQAGRGVVSSGQVRPSGGLTSTRGAGGCSG